MNWDEAATSLEEKYSHRGLRFTSSFEGLAPIQAYGHLDGNRFYFRLRGGAASLKVGVYDKDIEVAQKKHRNESVGYTIVTNIPKESDKELYPTVIQFESYVDASKGKMVELFSLLVDTLEPVAVEPQTSTCPCNQRH